MDVPPFYDIDLSQIPDESPPFNAIDLGLAPQNEATLDIIASGTGEVPPSGVGSATIEIVAAGTGVRGSGALVALTASGSGIYGPYGTGDVTIPIIGAGRGYVDWLSLIPPAQLQEVYRLVITGEADGLSDLSIGAISSWQATNQAGGRDSYVQAVIPAGSTYIDDIEARKNGELVIEKGFRFDDGSVRYEEILRSRFDNLNPARGRQTVTLTVSGYLQGKAAPSGARTLTGVRSITTVNGKRRVRCDVDTFLQPHMTVTALGESFRAGFINYYVNNADKFCEVGER